MPGTVERDISNMDDHIALPRKNGELVFEAPWEARAFGVAVALSESGLYRWPDFSQCLATEIAAAEQGGISSSYYERWLASLENLLIAKGLVSRDELDAATVKQALEEDDDHHHHGLHLH
jgi:nitrile hydratase accessory protein